MSMYEVMKCVGLLRALRAALMFCVVSQVVVAVASDTSTATQDNASGRTGGATTTWPLNGGNLESWHFSALKEVNTANVGQLGLQWWIDVDSPVGLATEPIVEDGTIYLTGTPDRVFAIDASTGKVRWQYLFKMDFKNTMMGSWAYRVNRGVGLWKGRVFIGTGDCRVTALSANSGAVLWQTQVCDPTQTGITGAPAVADGRVFIGYSASDTGTRGSVIALDAATGKIVWRFWNVPGNPARGYENKALAMAAKTWSGENWWLAGGGAVWDSIVYDPRTKLVIYGTAGAGTGSGGAMKTSGDRLFSDCIVALRADTGEYVWSYPTWKLAPPGTGSPENFHLVIADLPIDGAARRVAMAVTRWGGFIVLDAKTGDLISSKVMADTVLAQPSGAAGGERSRMQIGANWFPMSFNPQTDLAYVPVYQQPSQAEGSSISIADASTGEVMAKEPVKDYDMLGGAVGRLIAWDPKAGKPRWSVVQPLAINGGVLSTAGNLVFEGEGTGTVSAYSATTGKQVWSFETGSAIDGTPVSYEIKGKQYILVPVGLGSGTRLFSSNSRMATPQSKRGPSRLLAFALGAQTPFPYPKEEVPAVPMPPEPAPSAAVVSQGQKLVMKFGCWICHGGPHLDGAGAWVTDGAVPDLRYMPANIRSQFYAIVLGGLDRPNGMPGFADGQSNWPVDAQMTPDEAKAIYGFILSLQWNAYREDQHGVDKAATQK